LLQRERALLSGQSRAATGDQDDSADEREKGEPSS
jgi:hypothetical protein